MPRVENISVKMDQYGILIFDDSKPDQYSSYNLSKPQHKQLIEKLFSYREKYVEISFQHHCLAVLTAVLDILPHTHYDSTILFEDDKNGRKFAEKVETLKKANYKYAFLKNEEDKKDEKIAVLKAIPPKPTTTTTTYTQIPSSQNMFSFHQSQIQSQQQQFLINSLINSSIATLDNRIHFLNQAQQTYYAQPPLYTNQYIQNEPSQPNQNQFIESSNNFYQPPTNTGFM